MITLKHILCPIDFSEFSSRAFHTALALATWYLAELEALHVHPLAPAPPTKIPVVPPLLRLTPEVHEALVLQLRTFTEPARARGVSVDCRVVEGEPVREIVEAAERADLAVLGTHGRSGFERLMLGSVAEKVLRKAPCPVLTVPRLAPGSPPSDAPAFRHILCPIDFSEASLRGLEYALSLAKEADAELTLLHVVEAMPEEEPPEPLRPGVAGYRDYLRRMAGDRLVGLIPEKAREWCRPEVVVSPGKAHRGILRAAEQRRADLIVMGVMGRGAIDRLLFGTTTERVVRQATCPVLTLRGK